MSIYLPRLSYMEGASVTNWRKRETFWYGGGKRLGQGGDAKMREERTRFISPRPGPVRVCGGDS